MGSRTKRRVLVTGAGSGLGRAIAEQLARAGDRVVGTVRSPERASQLSAEARAAGLDFSLRPLEMTDARQSRELAAELEGEGGLDLLVHNAGFGVFGSVETVDARAAERQFAVNLLGPLELTRGLLPGLRRRGGKVIWIGSLAGRFALPFQAHYSASKAAVAALSDAMRLELGPLGVAVCCVEPGDFATGFTDARQQALADDSPYRERLASCLGEVERQERSGGDPAWVARAVERVSLMRRPPARVPVGRWARTLCLLGRMLPDGMRETLVRRAYRV